MKRRYEKPYLASERVFSLASQACDVSQPSPGICSSNITYEACFFPWKVRNITCGVIPPLPVEKS
ncbi:MAG: hypothetical protein V3W11_09225 [bacterium]